MEKVKTVEEGVCRLLTLHERVVPDFHIEYGVPGEYTDILCYDGKKIPLFYNRFDRVIKSISEYGSETEKNSALNVYSYTGNEIPLDTLIYRETEIAEFILHSETEEVTAFLNGDSVNLIAKMKNGTCANMSLATTMAPGSINQCEHRLITSKGMSSDRVFDMKTVRHDIYVFKNSSANAEVYDEDEYYLYGLDSEDTVKALTVHGILIGELPFDDNAETDKRHKKFIKAVHLSSDRCETVRIGEVDE